jgi:hypothetical protein
MNGKSTDFGGNDPGAPFDPELAALFSETHDAPLEGDAFIRGVIEDVQQARRRKLLHRISGTVLTLTAGAFAAPFVGERTFEAADWLAQNVSATGGAFASPAACALAALITWRIARRAFH